MSIIKKIPGFRSGVLWKKIVASIVYGLIVLVALGSLMGDPVTGKVNSARGYFDRGSFEFATKDYESALKQWQDSKTYEYTKADIEGELLKAKVELLLDQADTARKANKLTEASQKLQSAAALLPEYPRVTAVKENLSTYFAAEADKHLDKAVEALKEYDITTAESSISAAKSLYPDYERLAQVQEDYSDKSWVVKKIGPKPLNSAWDAAVAPVVDYLKSVLNDPKSVQYEEWSPVSLFTYQGQSYWVVRVKYRAKNLFGAYVLKEQLALIQHGKVVEMIDYTR